MRKLSNNRQVSFTVDERQSGMLVREFLLKVHHISQRSLAYIKNKGKIMWNGQSVTVRQELAPGDQVVLIYPEEEVSQYLVPQQIPLNILWEDQDLMAINKSPGICVHPTKGHPDHTLANGVLYHLQQRDEPGGFHAVNRLDMDTSGVVLVAKHKYAKQQLFLHQQQKRITSTYLALVQGKLEGSGVIDGQIRKITGKTIRREIHLHGQQARTIYESISTGEDYSLVSLCLETGRTHQIRVHLASIGHPLVGDTLYGGKSLHLNRRHCKELSRQALHAASMTFVALGTNQEVKVVAPLPTDMQAAVEIVIGTSGVDTR